MNHSAFPLNSVDANSQQVGTGVRTGIVGGLLPFAIGIFLASLIFKISPQVLGQYYSRLAIDIGIAMIMAVSLNIVNGMTGQFSIGHAGFMTLGGYTAGALTYYVSLWCWNSPLRHGGSPGVGEWAFAVSSVIVGLFLLKLAITSRKNLFQSRAPSGAQSQPRQSSILISRVVGSSLLGVMLIAWGAWSIWQAPKTLYAIGGAGEWLFAGACLLGGLVAAVAGYVVGLPSLRLRGDYLAIVTLGFGEILRVIFTETGKVLEDRKALLEAKWSQLLPPPVGGAIGFDGIPKYTNLFWVYVLLTITVVVAYRLKQSSLGRAMISVREDEIASQAMGVNVARYKVLAFVLAAFFAGLAGGLFAHESGINISPNDAGFQKSFDYVIMAVLGGRGSISGVMLAATILTALPEMLREVLPGVDQYRLILYALLLIIMMLVRPQGLFGIKEIWQYWPRSKAIKTEQDVV